MMNRNRTGLSSATMQSLGLNLNDKVIISGKVGILRYCGSTDFASGQWAGIEFQDAIGKNDGSVAGRSYFKCAPKHGIFAPLTRILPLDGNQVIYEDEENSANNSGVFTGVMRRGQSYDADQTVPVSPFSNYDPRFFNSSEAIEEFTPKIRSRTASLDSSPQILASSNSSGLKIGDKVLVCGQKIGIARYIGPTTFATGTWVGVELVFPSGKNDGTVAGFRYFICRPNHGIFSPIIKVQKISEEEFFEKRGSATSSEDDTNPSAEKPRQATHVRWDSKLNLVEEKNALNKSTPNTRRGSAPCRTSSHKTDECVGISRSECSPVDDLVNSNPKQRNHKICEDCGGERDLAEEKRSTLNKSTSNLHRRSAPTLQKGSARYESSMDLRKVLNFTLTTGMIVYYNNDIGTLRYIGEVDFAEGTWLGIEIRKPRGKNDGKVENKRYFTCAPNHGLMVRPNRTWCHGINCAQLLSLE